LFLLTIIALAQYVHCGEGVLASLHKSN